MSLNTLGTERMRLKKVSINNLQPIPAYANVNRPSKNVQKQKHCFFLNYIRLLFINAYGCSPDATFIKVGRSF